MSYPSGVQNTGRIVMSYPSGVQNTGRIVMSYLSGVQNTGRIVMSYPSGVQNTGRIVMSYPSGVQNTKVFLGLRMVGGSLLLFIKTSLIHYVSEKRHKGDERPERRVARTRPEIRVSEAERSDASFSDFIPCPVTFEVSGKLPCPGRGLFLCQDKKRRWGPVGASPHPMADEGQGPDDPNKCPIDTTQKPHSFP